MWQNAEHQPLKPPQSTRAKSWSISCKHLYTNWTSCTVINFPDTMWVSLQRTKPNTDLHIFRIRTCLTQVSHDLMSVLNVQFTKCKTILYFSAVCGFPQNSMYVVSTLMLKLKTLQLLMFIKRSKKLSSAAGNRGTVASYLKVETFI